MHKLQRDTPHGQIYEAHALCSTKHESEQLKLKKFVQKPVEKRRVLWKL